MSSTEVLSPPPSNEEPLGQHRWVQPLLLLVIEGVIPLLPALVAKLCRSASSGNLKPDGAAGSQDSDNARYLGGLIRIDTIYLVALGVSGVLWSISPIPPGHPILGGIQANLNNAHILHGLIQGAALALGGIALLFRGVAFLAIVIALGRNRPPLNYLPSILIPPQRYRPPQGASDPPQDVPLVLSPHTSIPTKVLVGMIFLVIEIPIALRSSIGDHLGSGLLAEHSADPLAFVWFLRWWPYAISHHLNPLFTHLLWAPKGYSLAWTTPIPSLGILFAPLTMATSAVVSYNVITIVSAPLGAYCAFLLARELKIGLIPAAIAGIIFGFSPYEFAQQRGHLNLIVIAIPPLIGLLWVRLRSQRISRSRFVIATAVLLVVQFGISNEIFGSLTVILAAVVGIDYFRSYGPARLGVRKDIRLLGLGYLITFAVLSPYLVDMVIHLHTRAINSPFGFSNDLYGIGLPNQLTPFGGSFASLTSRAIAKGSELDGYIALPLLAMGAYFIYRMTRYPSPTPQRIAATMGLAAFLCSLGPELQVGGNIWLPPLGFTKGIDVALLPWSAPARLPIVANILPDRLSLYTALFLGLVIGYGLDTLYRYGRSTRRRTTRSFIASVVVVAGIVMSLPLNEAPIAGVALNSSELPPLFRSHTLSTCIPRSATALFLPFGGAGTEMLDQEVSGFTFTMAGGYLGTQPRLTKGVQLYQALLAGAVLPANLTTSLPGVLRSLGVTEVVTPTTIGAPWTSYISALGSSFHLVCQNLGARVYRATAA